ncbi:hypothetical protein JCM9533A_08090 [Catenuloplanes niger JCM 9533]
MLKTRHPSPAPTSASATYTAADTATGEPGTRHPAARTLFLPRRVRNAAPPTIQGLRPRARRGRKPNAAIIRLACRRTDVLRAMLRTKNPYLSRKPPLRLDETHRGHPAGRQVTTVPSERGKLTADFQGGSGTPR